MAFPPETGPTALMRQALREIRDLKARVRELEQRPSESIAVVGMACRFPGGVRTPEDFWRLLRDGVDAISEVPGERWNIDDYFDPRPGIPGKIVTRDGGFISGVADFDAEFFGITPREASAMDPQQRHLLEVSWEAMENAGLSPTALRGSRTGVFVGTMGSDYAQFSATVENIDLHSGTGAALSILAGRLGHCFNFRGPVLTIDTACSSSLVAIHLACQSLRQKECDLAFAAGVNLILSPMASVAESMARMLSPDGRCRTFDAMASGIVRGEGVGVVLLKRLEEALRDGDSIAAVVLGSAVNHDGHSGGLTVPNELAQEEVLRAGLLQAGVNPLEVGYVETHGTGTILGDPIEAGALARVLGVGRSLDQPLWIGSVKTNLGHLEGAAGIAGFIKTVLAIQHAEIPPSLHFRQPNPHIPWDLVPLRVPVEHLPWPATGGRRVAGVSSFGLSGTNAHLILAGTGSKAATTSILTDDPQTLVISARTETALRELAGSYAKLLEKSCDIDLAAICHSAKTGRARLEQEFQASGSAGEIRRDLERFERTGIRPAPLAISDGSASNNPERRVPLPNYPWQHRRFWLEGPPRRSLKTDQPVPHPLVQQRLWIAEDGATRWRFETVLDAGDPEYLKDHVVFDRAVLPGACFLEMVAEVGRVVFGTGTFELREVEWHQPLVFGPPKVVQILVRENSDQCSIEILSRNQKCDIPAWVIHCRGQIARNIEVPAQNSSRLTDFKEFAPFPVDVERYYETLQAYGIDYGPSFRVISKISAGSDISIGHIATRSEDYNRYQIFPSLLDGAFQILGAALPARDEVDVYLPIGVDRMRILLPGQRELAAVARLRAGSVVTNAVLTFDVWLFTPSGALVAELAGLRMQRASKEALRRSVETAREDLFEITWERSAKSAHATLEFRGDCLIFCEPGGFGADLVKAALRAGGISHLVVPGDQYLEEKPGITQLCATSPDDFERLFREHPASLVVFLWGFDLPVSSTVDELDISIAKTLGGFLHVIQALTKLKRPSGAKLHVVTKGAFDGDNSPVNPVHRALWGMARSAALEHPELGLNCFEVEGKTAAADLFAEITSDHAESQMMFRDGVSYVARLQPVMKDTKSRVLELRPDRVYVVTGAFGALGPGVVRRMARHGARRLLLLSRSGAKKDDTMVSELEHSGVRMLVRQVDVGDFGEMKAAFDFASRELGEIAGIVHAAGVLEDGVLGQMDWERFQRPFRSKVRGAWILDQMTRKYSLDFFVLFSSSTALLGSAGQSNYSAGNAFLDGIATERRGLGLPGLSIQWGAWAGAGMAQPSGLRTVTGLGLLEPDRALDRWEALVARDSGRSVVSLLSVDWRVFAASYPTAARSPFFRRVVEFSEPVPQFRDNLTRTQPRERLGELRRFLRDELAVVMRLSVDQISPRARFFDVGMDSLLAVDFKNRIQAALEYSMSSTLVFDYPTLEQLTNHIATNIPGIEIPIDALETQESVLAPTAGTELELDALTDDQLARLLADRLQAVE